MASRVLRPVEALHGIGRRQAVVLTEYGIHSVGLLASVPPATGPRLVGRPAPAATRRTAPAPAAPAPAAPATVRHVFPRLTLGGAEARAALLETMVRLGLLLPRPDGPRPDAEAVFAGGGRGEKTWRLAEPSVHDDDLRLIAYQLMDAPGLHRSRLTELALEGEDIIDADPVAQEITLDDARDVGSSPKRPSMASTAKFGHRVIGPATVFRRLVTRTAPGGSWGS